MIMGVISIVPLILHLVQVRVSCNVIAAFLGADAARAPVPGVLPLAHERRNAAGATGGMSAQ